MSRDARVLVVTGASSGIGAAAARYFGQRGWRVALAARRRERLEALARELAAQGGQVLVVPTDVTRWEDVANLAQQVWQAWGRVDVLLNNAGLGRLNWLEAMDPHRDIAHQVQVNLVGAIWVVRAFLPGLLEQGHGHIINVASVASFAAPPTYSVYAATKFGLRGFTEALRYEVEPLGLRVSAVYLGSVATEFLDHAWGPLQAQGRTTPKRWVLSPEAVARALWGLVQRPRRNLVLPRWYGWVLWLHQRLPGLLGWFTRDLVRRRPAAAGPRVRKG